MINYVVNFDEIQEALENLLSNIGLREGFDNIELFSKEIEFQIPPMKGSFNFNIDNEGDMLELFFQIDGFNPQDRIELIVDGLSKGEIAFCYSNRLIRFLPTDNRIQIIYHNDGGYKNLIVHSTFRRR